MTENDPLGRIRILREEGPQALLEAVLADFRRVNALMGDVTPDEELRAQAERVVAELVRLHG